MYKISKYNYAIDYKGKKLFFNAMKGSGMLMTLSEWESVKNFFNNLDKFKQEFPNDFEKLKQMGYIIDSDFDELAYLKFMNKTATFGNKSYTLFINPTLECNFRCWYCYEEHNKGYMSKNTIEKIKLHIKRKIENHEINLLNLGWFGGEPLLYFDEVIYPISKYTKQLIDENNIPFHNSVTTNAYCINEDMINKMQEIGLRFFQITLDGNRDRHNQIRNCSGKPTYDIILQNIIKVCQNIENAIITLRINYDDVTLKKNAEEILSDFPDFVRPKLYIDMHRVWQTIKINNDTLDSFNEELDKFIVRARDNGYNIRCNGVLFSTTYTGCYVCRTNFACINFDGKVYKCTACSFTEKDCFGELKANGDIHWNINRISKLYGYSPLENPQCMNCKQLPICLGPCPKHYMQNNHKVNCIYDTIEREPYQRIIDYYEESLLFKKNQCTTTI